MGADRGDQGVGVTGGGAEIWRRCDKAERSAPSVEAPASRNDAATKTFGPLGGNVDGSSLFDAASGPFSTGRDVKRGVEGHEGLARSRRPIDNSDTRSR